MREQRPTVLSDLAVRAAIKQAWQDSLPGLSGSHEEGGFVLRDLEGNLSVIRWPKGSQNAIALPSHQDCRIVGNDIVATFHTHPNTGVDFLQEPSETDRRAVQDDTDLKGPKYEGEFVISQQSLYLIAANGLVSEVGSTSEILPEL